MMMGSSIGSSWSDRALRRAVRARANRIEGCGVQLADWSDCADEDVALVSLDLEDA